MCCQDSNTRGLTQNLPLASAPPPCSCGDRLVGAELRIGPMAVMGLGWAANVSLNTLALKQPSWMVTTTGQVRGCRHVTALHESRCIGPFSVRADLCNVCRRSAHPSQVWDARWLAIAVI